MKVINLILTTVIMSLVIGCGGSGNYGEDAENKYTGLWYISESDQYLDIKNNGKAYYRECSVHDGYKINNDISAYIHQNELKINFSTFESTVQISLSADKQAINVVGTNYSFEKVQSLPSACFSDAIEITFVSPTSAPLNQETSFIVNFDYRLSESSTAIVELGYSSNGEGTFTLTNDQLDILSEGTGSGSLTAELTPEMFENSAPYRVYAVLYEPYEGDTFILSASDSVAISVTNNFASLSAAQKNEEAKDKKIISRITPQGVTHESR